MSAGTELAALVAVAQAIVAAGPSEIRASMWAVESTAQALAERAAKSLFETAAAPADLDLAERCAARAQWYLCELSEHEMRGHSAADRAEALDRESRRQASGEKQEEPGRLVPRVPVATPNYSSARWYAETALRSAEEAVDAFHEAGLPALVAHWTAQCVEIERLTALLKIACDASNALYAARNNVRQIGEIVKAGGLIRHGRYRRPVVSPGTRKVPERYKRAKRAIVDALGLLWSPEACAAEEDPIIVALRAEYEAARVQVDACPSRMPGTVAK